MVFHVLLCNYSMTDDLSVGQKVALFDKPVNQLVRKRTVEEDCDPVVFVHVIGREKMIAGFDEIVSLVFVELQVDDVDFVVVIASGFIVFAVFETETGAWNGLLDFE